MKAICNLQSISAGQIVKKTLFYQRCSSEHHYMEFYRGTKLSHDRKKESKQRKLSLAIHWFAMNLHLNFMQNIRKS